MSGQGFVLTPNGIRPLEPSSGGAVVKASDFVATLAAVPRPADAAATPKATSAHAPKASAPQRLSRREYAKELRARLRLVERDIKQLRELEEERAEIKRLLAALKAPPARVTTLHARQSG